MSERGALRQNLPYLHGVYVAAAAISDARLVVDGPFCVVQKAEMHAAHDPGSTLLVADGPGRLVPTDLQAKGPGVLNALRDREGPLVTLLAEVAALPATGVVLLAAMDIQEAAAAPLERYRRVATERGGAPIVLVDPRSLDGDWLDGFARSLDRLAERLPLPPAAPEPASVALVGNFMDRRAGDQHGNLAELGRLLEGIGVTTASTWLDGGPTASLQQAHRASAVVSLPYARAAARRLASRLGVPCVDAELPLGVAATCRFLRTVADVTGRAAAADAFLAREVDALVADVRPLAFRFLSGKTALLNADPHAGAALAELLAELGVEVVGLTVTASPELLDPAVLERLAPLAPRYEPPLGPRSAAGQRDDAEADADVLIASTLFPHDPRRATWLPFGYPNYLRHPTTLRPFLGFQGVRTWVDDLVEACLRADLRRRGRDEEDL